MNTLPILISEKKLENEEQAIGILLNTFTHIKTFENILREAGISFVIHKGKGFYKSREVIDMLQLLYYLTDERQEISLLSCLRGQIFGLSDPEIFDLFYGEINPVEKLRSSDKPYIKRISNQLESWRVLSTRLPITELIRTIISQRSLVATYSVHPRGDQSLLNIEKLMDIARRFQNDEKGSLEEFVGHCLEMADRDEDEGEAVIASGGNVSVSIMTIHAAKGLEFPMVIIPQLDRKIPSRPDTGKPLRLYESEKNNPLDWNHMEGEIPVWPVEMPGFDYRKKTGPLGHLLTKRNRLEDMAENRRVFYVGCTRAENHLVLIGQQNKKSTDNKISLTPNDYRERATIFQILSDIYGLDTEESKEVESLKGSFNPVIINSNVNADSFHGFEYDPEKPDERSFGNYDSNIKNLDLSAPVESNPYFQLSFTSIQTFMKCPFKFYYNTILKLKEGQHSTQYSNEVYSKDSTTIEQDSNEYGSKDALYIGNLIHQYLEKHKFGEPFDYSLFEYIKKRVNASESKIDYCLDKAERLLEKTVNDNNLIALLADAKNYAEIPFLVSALPGIEFRGIMDRLVKDHETGLWSIIDWKSNDLEGKSPDQVIIDNGYDTQLAFYKWAFEKILKEKIDKQYIYFLSKGCLKECNWQGDPLDIFNSIALKINNFEGSSDWLKDLEAIRKEGSECRFCGYSNVVCR